ncbi:YIP1 family protein [Roseovarius sp. M141]|uniref:YIP1 family protein n=1 Tax=Roseovarius sp. M141 TaxID=2583806 RepID=UPI0020CCF018|nr:YIP1 family protein [Roseovarius sp. M141]MCQ0092734.1 YIP1 family protein [Roseovarius sp. M141]
MPAARDIVATYRGPGAVMRRLLAMGQREDRALVILMAGCVVMYIAQWPRLARQAYMTGEELNPLLGGALLAWAFIAPLIFYGIALISHWIARLAGGKGTSFGARMALFWALLAASPLVLLHGLVAGFIGPGPGLTVVGAAWLVAFALFWALGLREAEWGRI